MVKDSSEFYMGTGIVKSNVLAADVFEAIEIYPVFDAMRDGVKYKIALDSHAGHWRMLIKGYLIERFEE
ncbi:hypothetical protein D3C81_2206410 [compost metagenome]